MKKHIDQPWSLPQELTLPTPRPIKGKGVARAHYLRTVGGKFLLFGGMALVAWILSGLSQAPGATIGAKWERYVEGGPYEWLTLALLVYSGGFVVWVFHTLWYRKAERLLRWGKPARAVVTDVESRATHDKSETITEYWESKLEYQDDAGNIIRRKVRGKKHKHEVLTVLYDPDKPKKFLVYPVPEYEIGGPGGS
jgi:hypothetical protein